MTSLESKDDKRFYKLIDLVNETPELQWDYNNLSSNRNIFLEDIIANISPTDTNSVFPWNKDKLSENPNITLDFVKKYPDINTETTRWDWLSLTYNTNISLAEILENIDLPWYFYNLSKRITNYDFILNHLDKPWYWNIFSLKAPFNFILTHPRLPWDPNIVSLNESVTLTDVLSNLDFKWDYPNLSRIIPLQTLTTQKIFAVDYKNLSANKTLTSKYLLRHLDEKWDPSYLSANTNLNFNALAVSNLDLSNLFVFNSLNMIQNTSVGKSFILKYINNFRAEYITDYIIVGKILLLDILNIYSMNTLNYILYETLSYIDINLDLLKILFPNNIIIINLWNVISKNKYIKPELLFQIAKLYRQKVDFKNFRTTNLTYDFIYKFRNENWNMYTLNANTYNFEYDKISIVNRLKNNYIIKQKKKLLNSYLIPDLNNIIIEY